MDLPELYKVHFFAFSFAIVLVVFASLCIVLKATCWRQILLAILLGVLTPSGILVWIYYRSRRKLREKMWEICYVLLFSVSQEFQTKLDDKIALKELLQEFANNNITLSQNSTILVKKAGNIWQIKDGQEVYTIKKNKKEDKLNVYCQVKDQQCKKVTC